MISDLLAEERAKPNPRTLTLGQCHQLDNFTKRWNASREARGLKPLTADDALSEGLRALTEMITDGLEAQKAG